MIYQGKHGKVVSWHALMPVPFNMNGKISNL